MFRNVYAGLRQRAAATEWIRDVYLAYNLAISLFLRDLRGRYRRSMLGHAWAILQPLMFLGLWITIRSFFGIRDSKIPYPLLIFSGMIPWNFFQGIINGSTPAIMNNAGIIKKINIDREIFLIVNVLNMIFDMLMMILLFSLMLLYYRADIGLNLLWAPLYLLLMGLLGFAVGMFVSAFGIFKSDITMAFTYVLQIWMFLNPIIYSVESVPAKYRFLYYLNPTVPLIEGFRNSVVLNQGPDWIHLMSGVVFILATLAIAWPLFRKRAAFFADDL